ncbi:phosphomevalonate kinase, peroxisomal isoform X2 [Capsicum annuum]|uniref:phosphomevalonate kinase, peroxisomal isoform X2 n=1 Tax=Capsicum annuum TaxID=4072 RepID=UPI001FB0B647|nr:phosphomevalonate kinase, peroxisomal isoform X2 [Capsicum annuum]
MAVVASAPGKVLMTGGYLVLERPNAGIVLSTNARFYAIVKPLYEEIKPESWAWEDDDNLLYGTFQTNNVSNCIIHAGLDITILGCNEFYSYRNQIEARGLPLTPESLASLPPFASITFNAEESTGENRKPEVAKTGLGSSAAMTTAVVAALLHYLGVVNLSSLAGNQLQGKKDVADLDVLHVIAQTAHCIAQGKVGSGFDVSSAVYGSQRYIRFSPEVLSSAQNAGMATPLTEVIGDVLKAKWDHERTKFSLPPLMTLLLGEPGSGGSSTPSMVGAVKKWQKSDPQDSLETWRRLSEGNSALEAHLNTLCKLAERHYNAYECIINACSLLPAEKWLERANEPTQAEIVKELLGARDAMLRIRYQMRKMGEAAGIPIEPESQSQLLDATMNMEGVLLAGIPGAGGFDAVFAVTLGASSKNVTQAWSSLNVLAMLVREDPHGVSLENNDPRAKEITAAISSIQLE